MKYSESDRTKNSAYVGSSWSSLAPWTDPYGLAHSLKSTLRKLGIQSSEHFKNFVRGSSPKCLFKRQGSYIAASLKKKLGYADYAASVQDKTYHLHNEPGKKLLMCPDIVVKRKADGAVLLFDVQKDIEQLCADFLLKS